MHRSDLRNNYIIVCYLAYTVFFVFIFISVVTMSLRIRVLNPNGVREQSRGNSFRLWEHNISLCSLQV